MEPTCRIRGITNLEEVDRPGCQLGFMIVFALHSSRGWPFLLSRNIKVSTLESREHGIEGSELGSTEVGCRKRMRTKGQLDLVGQSNCWLQRIAPQSSHRFKLPTFLLSHDAELWVASQTL
jgi:hypothetical protein